MYRKKIEYATKHELVEKTCSLCKCVFKVENLYKNKDKKYCSKECMKTAQSNHLKNIQPLCNLKPRKQQSRREMIKQCVICGDDFTCTTGNFGKQACGIKCGHVLATKNAKIKITKEQFLEAVNKSKNTYELSDILQVSIYTLMRRSKEFGIKYTNEELKKRADGYWGYGTHKNHRIIYESHYGVKLESKQGVHHIDNVKDNNDIDNLFLTQSVSQHKVIHKTLEKCGWELFKYGVIKFNKEKSEYFIDWDSFNILLEKKIV